MDESANTGGEVRSDSAGVESGAPDAESIGLTLKLYATLQDLLPRGAVKNAVAIEADADVSLNDLIDRYQVPRELAHLVLVNGVYHCGTDRDARGVLKDGDVIAIWPPVAGG